LSKSTTFTYDAVGNRLSLNDSEDNTTTWTYDTLNRVTKEVNELDNPGISTDDRRYEYDAASNLVKKFDRLNRETRYEYDRLGRMTREDWRDAGGTSVRKLDWEYFTDGRLKETDDNTNDPAKYKFTYDGMGRMTETELTGMNFSSARKLTYGYDANSNRTSLKATIGTTNDFQNTYT
jgi:YD repeat-containing protein